MPKATSATRRRLLKTARFEVFKRDKFTCQYCGQKAPDVVLQVDHLVAVANGGGNDFVNLLTSCVDCNLGKGARCLDDASAVVKQRKALEVEGERIEQVKMLAEWRRSVSAADQIILDEIVRYVEKAFYCKVGPSGRQKINRWVSRYPSAILLESIDICARQYLEFGGERPTDESILKAFDYLPRVAAVRSDPDPNRAKLAYISGILKNRLHYFGPGRYREMMAAYLDAGCLIEDAEQVAKTCRNWTQFCDRVEGYIEGMRHG